MATKTINPKHLLDLGRRIHKVKDEIDATSDAFTKREKEIIIELANGLTSDEISSKLYISKNTVDTHRKNIYRKGNFRSIRDVVLFSFFL